MNTYRVVVQLVDPDNGQRSDPRMGTRESLTQSFLDVKEKDDAFLNAFVLVLMEEVEREGEVGFCYSLAPLVTVSHWIELFPVPTFEEVNENV